MTEHNNAAGHLARKVTKAFISFFVPVSSKGLPLEKETSSWWLS